MRRASELLDGPAEADTVPENFILDVRGRCDDARITAWATSCHARGVDPIASGGAQYMAKSREVRRLVVRGYVPVATVERPSSALAAYAIVGFEPGRFIIARPGTTTLERIADDTPFLAIEVHACSDSTNATRT